MAQAAYCSQCGTNVFVGPDGGCPNGHGPESLSNFYEVADEASAAAATEPSTPADWATAGAAEQPTYAAPVPEYTPPAAAYSAPEPAYGGGMPVATPPKKSKTGLIIGIVAVLLICCILTVVGGYFGYKSLGGDDETTDVTTTDTTADTTTDSTDEGISGEEVTEDEVDTGEGDSDGSTGEVDTEALVEEMTPEVEGLIAHFYPNFTMNDFAIAGDPNEDSFPVHIIAESDEVEGFFITFFATRYTSGGDASAPTSYTDPSAGTVWEHPETAKYELDQMFGPNAAASSSVRVGVMEAFMAEHPDGTMNITKSIIDSGSQVTLKGIPDEDLEAWYDDFDSFTSVITKSGNTWAETSFEEY